jgi:hypothetical protein
MEKQLSPDEVFSVIEILYGSEEDINLGLQIIKQFNSYTNLCIASYFVDTLKSEILKHVNCSFNANDTNLKDLFRYIETPEDKELFSYILKDRLKKASDTSQLKKRMKNIIKILEIDA